MAAAQKAAERERKAQEKAAARRPQGPAADDRHGDPDRRQGRDLAARPGRHPRRLRDAVRRRQALMTRGPDRRRSRGGRPGSTRRGGRRRSAGPSASWPAWGARSRGRSSSRTCGRGRRRSASRPTAAIAWLKASGPGPAYEGPLLEVFRARDVAARRPAARRPRRASRGSCSDDAGPTLRADAAGRRRRPRPRRLGADPARVRGAAAIGRGRRRRRGDARRGRAGRAARGD